MSRWITLVYRIIFRVLIMGVFGVGSASRAAVPDDVINIYSKIYSTRHGLPSDAVSSITQDQQGRIWICTQRGIASYNGHDFTSYLSENYQEISSFYNSIIFDSRRRAWIGTTNGVATISDNTIMHLTMNWPGDVPSIRDIQEDAEGRIWALCNSTSVLRLDNRSMEKPVWDNEPEQVVITRLRRSPDGRIWMATSSGFHILDNGIVTTYPNFSNFTVLDFCLDSDHSGWMVDSSGSLSRFSSNHITKMCTLPAAAARTVYDMAVTQSGSLWIATFRGLFLYAGEHLTAYDYRNGLASNVIWSIFIDREGCLWYASDNGLGKIPGLIFRRLMPTQNLPITSVTGLCEDKMGQIWIAANDGLIRISSDSIRIWRDEDDLVGDSVHAVAVYQGRVAFTTPYGLFRMDSNDRIHRLSDDESAEYLNLLPDGSNIWLVSDEGLFRYLPSGKIEDLTSHLGLQNQSPISAVYKDKKNNLWVATDGDGVCMMQNSEPANIQYLKGLPSMRAFSIIEDGHGTIWIGTLAGLCSVRDMVVQNVFSIKQGLMSEDIWTVLADADNYIWVGTSRGLSSIRDGQIQNYDYEDGLSGEDFVSNCRYVDDQGRLWFGGTGITIVDPSEKMPSVKPMTYLRYALINNDTLPDNTVIPSGRNTFEFGFMCSSFRNELQNQYRYQLLGFDSFRSPPTTISNVRYTNLPKGRYTFTVEACSRDGQWSDKPASISFEVLPAWYERRLVWVLGGCILLLIIRIFIRWRNFKLARLNIWLRNEVKRQTNVIQQQLYRLEEQKNQLEHQAVTDELTRLFNRRFFYKKLQEAWMMSRIEKIPISIIVFDLDHFKEINDMFGHLMGDTALFTVSRKIAEIVPKNSIVARFGGEEFIVLLERTNLQEAVNVAESIRQGIEAIDLEDDTLSGMGITISGGVASAVAGESDESPDLLVKAADDALYRAKTAGRNRVASAYKN
ncbi:diguanylate cyclase [bacterium]|nr:diguanylate cyclase [candidate division CSSED10-310 bacterium]